MSCEGSNLQLASTERTKEKKNIFSCFRQLKKKKKEKVEEESDQFRVLAPHSANRNEIIML